MITAGRLPAIRDELRQTWAAGLEAILATTSERVLRPFVAGVPEPIPGYVDRLLGWLDAAELYWATEDMTAVAVQSGASLPSYRLHVADVPCEVGLLVWARPVAAVPGSGGGGWVAVTGALWGPATVDRAGSPGVHVVTLADAYQYAATADVPDQMRAVLRSSHLMYHDEAPLPWGEHEVAMRNEALRSTLATWLLCGQQITAESEVPVDRSVRRGYQRAGRPPPVVRQVALRRAQRPRPDDPQTAGEGVQWRHRWVVSGYWRNTWYARQERHRPQWIAEHVKGPDGLPLIGGEKVNVLRR